jgi:RNA polymerase sigma-70 factor (ECF subfamily)
LDPKEIHIIELFNKNPHQAMSMLYDEYYKYLYETVYRIIPVDEDVQDILQNVFIEIWRKYEVINIQNSLKLYLRKAAINRCMNHLRQNTRVPQTQLVDELEIEQDCELQLQIEAEETSKLLDATIDSLPLKCRIVFGLSRYEDMNYNEIAENLGISVKTVEHHITKALKLLRNKLVDLKK